LERLLARPAFAAANVGIVTGLSGVTIVDCDEPGLVKHAFEMFGETSLVTATPSGGAHAWYRADGERCATLRGRGLAIDIKAEGGFVVVPPSVRPSGPYAGRAYSFIRGDLDELPRLPTLRPDVLEQFRSQTPERIVHSTATKAALPEGVRNVDLFLRALRLATGTASFDALLEALLAANDRLCQPPLDSDETAKVARSAWRYESEGRNWVSTPSFVIAHSQLDAVPDAGTFLLLAILWRYHGSRQEPFAIVPEAMRAKGVVPGMSTRGIRQARERLVAGGYLVQVHQGGRGQRDPSLYRLGVNPRLSLPD
jgi:hypothetical protein